MLRRARGICPALRGRSRVAGPLRGGMRPGGRGRAASTGCSLGRVRRMARRTAENDILGPMPGVIFRSPSQSLLETASWFSLADRALRFDRDGAVRLGRRTGLGRRSAEIADPFPRIVMGRGWRRCLRTVRAGLLLTRARVRPVRQDIARQHIARPFPGVLRAVLRFWFGHALLRRRLMAPVLRSVWDGGIRPLFTVAVLSGRGFAHVGGRRLVAPRTDDGHRVLPARAVPYTPRHAGRRRQGLRRPRRELRPEPQTCLMKQTADCAASAGSPSSAGGVPGCCLMLPRRQRAGSSICDALAILPVRRALSPRLRCSDAWHPVPPSAAFLTAPLYNVTALWKGVAKFRA
jgi:hypothetical protein